MNRHTISLERILDIPIGLDPSWFLACGHAQSRGCRQLSAHTAEALAEKLASGTWTHDCPITVEEATELGLPLSTEMPQEVYDLMQLYPQTAQRRPSVQYVPIPYRRRGSEPSSSA
jgi:ClpP class serine protease